jgi:hypothetical protein
MKPSSCKAKGRLCAKQVKEMILKCNPDLHEDDVVVASSGQTGEDILLSAKARGLLPISAECKNVERLNIWEAIEQAQSNCKGHLPVVFFRRNRSDIYAAVPAEEFLRIMANARAYADLMEAADREAGNQ